MDLCTTFMKAMVLKMMAAVRLLPSNTKVVNVTKLRIICEGNSNAMLSALTSDAFLTLEISQLKREKQTVMLENCST